MTKLLLDVLYGCEGEERAALGPRREDANRKNELRGGLKSCEIDRLLRAYTRPVEVTTAADQQESRWFISKDAVVSGLGLLGIKQGGPEAPLSKPRRKRVIRKKVASG